MIDPWQAFRETAAQFARRELEPLLAGEGRDGDLNRLPAALRTAREIGVTASADPQSPGYDYGVWGRACRVDGPAASLAVLREIARVCAGAAACIHLEGLAAAFSADGAPPAAIAWDEPGWVLDWPSIRRPPAEACRLAPAAAGGFLLSGQKQFIQAAPGWKRLLVFCAGPDGWRLASAPKSATGVRLADAGRRMGLAAIDVFHAGLENCPVDAAFVRAGDPAAFLRWRWLGWSAIAVGNAQGAWRAAAAYARERYQGGTQLEALPAVRGLLGESRSRLAAADAFLESIARRDRGDAAALGRAMAAKLRITVDCSQAVSDCLQVLGGYGYMEDYRLEKRLRDAMALKLTAGKPEALRALCAAGEWEDAS